MRNSVERFGGEDACLLVANAEGLITHVSDSAVVMLGYDHRREVIGRLGREFWARPEDAVKAKEELWSVGHWNGEFHARHRSGRTIRVYGKAWRAQTDANENVAVMFISSIEHSLEMLTLCSHPGVIALPELLIRGSIHDLNNIIGIATGALQLVRVGESSADAGRKEALAMVAESCDRASALLKEMNSWLAAWTVKAAGAKDLHVGELALQAAKLATIGSGVTIQSNVADNLFRVRGDAAGLFRVIVNLVLNARQAMNNCGRLTISADNVSFPEEGLFVRLSISDTGPGMSSEVLARIFELGFSSRDGGGGIGLAVAKHIVSQNGGRIEVASRPGQGTTFRILLPAAQ